MVVQRKELLESLKLAMPGVETGSAVLQGADSFIFHDGKIYTYNDNISVSVPIKSDSLISEKIEGCVKADEFFKIISKFSSDEIHFEVSDKGTWILKSGKAKVEMTLLEFDYSSRLKNIEFNDDLWLKLSDDFISGVEHCRMIGNKTRFSGIYFNKDKIISTDGNQLNIYSLTDCDLPSFWISDNSINELMKIGKFNEIQSVNNWIHFKTENDVIFSLKSLQADSYPFNSVLKLIENNTSDKSIFHRKFPKNLYDIVERASVFSSDISEHLVVKFNITTDGIEISSERNSGKYAENILWDDDENVEFEPFVFYVDIEQMKFILLKTAEFYLLKSPSGKSYRLLFVTEKSKHLFATLSLDD